MASSRTVGGRPENQVAVRRELTETSTLLNQTPPGLSVWARRYRSTHKCINSKAALLILLWSFIVGLTYGIIYNPSIYVIQRYFTFIILCFYSGDAVFLCFYPVAGFLADIKFGRYRTVVRSLYVLLVTLIIGIIASVILVPIWLSFSTNYDMYDTQNPVFSLMTAVAIILVIPTTASFVGFNANVIQFGMDQLHDSPGDHQSLFIHWYVWVYYLGLLITRSAWEVYNHIKQTNKFLKLCAGLLVFIPAASTLLLIVSLSIAHRRRRWFLVDPPRLNPYKLVYRVTKFARQHKVPVHRSAFTYCEDDVPSGLDLGKDKYGGPFTTEQVEDVKTFYGILKVLFALGPVFFLDIATDPLLYFYARHISYYYNQTSGDFLDYNPETIKWYLLQDGLLSHLLVVFCIPFFLLLLRPFVFNCIPGMLKRIGLGIVLMILSLICTFSMDTAAHMKDNVQISCMFPYYLDPLNSTIQVPSTSYLTIQRSLSSLSTILIYVALYEFVCSQSPHSMKGLLIGLSLAIKGLFETFAFALVTIPFYHTLPSFPSCGMYYYLMFIVVGLVAMLVYACIARRYKYRERDEPCNVHRYVEDYYSKIQQDDYD